MFQITLNTKRQDQQMKKMSLFTARRKSILQKLFVSVEHTIVVRLLILLYIIHIPSVGWELRIIHNHTSNRETIKRNILITQKKDFQSVILILLDVVNQVMT